METQMWFSMIMSIILASVAIFFVKNTTESDRNLGFTFILIAVIFIMNAVRVYLKMEAILTEKVGYHFFSQFEKSLCEYIILVIMAFCLLMAMFPYIKGIFKQTS